MSKPTKNRFENWSERDVAEYIELEKGISSLKAGGYVGVILGIATIFSGTLDNFGTALALLILISAAFYVEIKADKNAKRLNELRTKNATWPP